MMKFLIFASFLYVLAVESSNSVVGGHVKEATAAKRCQTRSMCEIGMCCRGKNGKALPFGDNRFSPSWWRFFSVIVPGECVEELAKEGQSCNSICACEVGTICVPNVLCKSCGSICMSVDFVQKMVVYFDVGCSSTCASSGSDSFGSAEASAISIFSEFLSSSGQTQGPSQIQIQPFASLIDSSSSASASASASANQFLFGNTNNNNVIVNKPNQFNKPPQQPQFRPGAIPPPPPPQQAYYQNNYYPNQHQFRPHKQPEIELQQQPIVSKPHPCASPCPQAVPYPVPVLFPFNQPNLLGSQTDKATTTLPAVFELTTASAATNPTTPNAMELFFSNLIRDYGINLTSTKSKQESSTSVSSSTSTTSAKTTSTTASKLVSIETARLKKLLPFSYF